MIVLCISGFPLSGPLHIKPPQPVSCFLPKYFLYFKVLQLTVTVSTKDLILTNS